MSKTVIGILIVIGVILAIIAIIVVLKKSKSQPVVVTTTTKKTTKSQKKDEFDFDELMKIAQNPKTTTKELIEVLNIFNTYFRMDDKTAQQYIVFLSKCLTHENSNKDVFQFFHNNIKPKNTQFKTELEKMELNALG